MGTTIIVNKHSLVGNLVKLPFKVVGLGIIVAGVTVVGAIDIIATTLITKDVTTIK